MPTNFRLPGPTAMPPAVVAAMQREMIPHRGRASIELYRSIVRRAREVHRTDGDVMLWPASGSAGWEIAVVNLVSPGDPVLCVSVGAFGERFIHVAKTFGLDVRLLERPWGEAVTADMLRAALNENPEVKAVFLTHNETSTGVTNPLQELAAVVRDHGALIAVDAVSSAAGLPLEMDKWGIDFVLSGSQKAWMCPPGLAIVGAGPRALDAARRSTFPKFFWDLAVTSEFAAKGMAPTTQPLSLFYAFDAALDMILAEGVETVWARHRVVGERARAGIRELGLRLFSDEAYASNTVTAVWAPEGIASSLITTALERDHDVIVGGGQGSVADKIFRIGHMGYVNTTDIEGCIDALDAVLDTLDIRRDSADKSAQRTQYTPVEAMTAGVPT